MNYCSNTYMRFYELFGIVLYIFKYFIPILIIIYGTFDLFGIVIKIKDKKNNNLKKFFIRIVSGIIIFFIPTIIIEIFERVGLDKTEYSCMYNCVLDINKCDYQEESDKE